MAPYSRIVVVVVTVLLAAGQAFAEVVWRGDFESGDLTQWTKAQEVSPDRLEVLDGGSGHGGRFSLKATVVQGDNPIGASGNRNELTYTSYEASGTERYYRWQTKFADDYPSADAWQLFTQWHHEGPSGSPPVEFFARKEEVILNIQGEPVWRMPLVRGRWIDFVFHVKWSPDPSEGFVELYVDGKKVLDKLPVATQFPGQLNYLKQGLYRDAKVQQTGVIFHDGMTIGTELADVMPELASSRPSEPAAPEAPPQVSQPASGTGATSPSEPTPEQLETLYKTAGCSSGSGGPLMLLAMGVALTLVWRHSRKPARALAWRRNRR